MFDMLLDFPDPSWAGRVCFFELVFGIWLSYMFLILMWEYLFKEKLEEWRYAFITFVGASFFLINHYYQEAPFYMLLLLSYTVVFVGIYYYVLVKPLDYNLQKSIIGVLTSAVFTVAFIFFEHIAQWGWEAGIHEFWFMFISYFGYLVLIPWRGDVLKDIIKKNEK